MLSIGAMSGGQARYYTSLSASEDYYVGGKEPPGRWIGEGALALGLKGEVNKEAFHTLFDGFSANGEKRLVQNAGAENRQPGWDLTFSAPKTVSVLWSQARPETRGVIEEAHFEAVKKAITYLEEETSFTRRGKGGHKEEPAKLVVATFEHGASRAQDPQLHTHALILNIAVREDGTTGSLVSKPFYEHKMTAGALYRAELAMRLEQRLGFHAEPGETSFEVKGVPETLTHEFSKRREEIEKSLQASGKESAAASAVAALRTREVKEQRPRETLLLEWREAGQRHGFTDQDVEKLREAPRLVRVLIEEMQASFEAGLQKLNGQENYSERELTRYVAEAASERGIGARYVRNAVREYLSASPEVGLVENKHGEKRFITRDLTEGRLAGEILRSAAERDLLYLSQNRDAGVRELLAFRKREAPEHPVEGLDAVDNKPKSETLDRKAQGDSRPTEKVSPERIEIAGNTFRVGDRVSFGGNAPMYRVRRGDSGTVTGFDASDNLLKARLDSGERVALPVSRYDQAHLERIVTAKAAKPAQAENAYSAHGMDQEQRAQEAIATQQPQVSEVHERQIQQQIER